MKKVNKKIYKKGRNFIKGILVIFAIIALFGIFTNSTMGKKESLTNNYTIQKNETLWNIANNICENNKNENLNIQNIVIEIKKINKLSDSKIYTGQVIQLPVY